MTRPRLLATNVDAEVISYKNTDLLILAQGYEPRWSHVFSSLTRSWQISPATVAKKTLLLRYQTELEFVSRDRETASDLTPNALLCDVTKESGTTVYDLVAGMVSSKGLRHVVVDYSCMSRGLYLPLTNLVRTHGCQITFCYSTGSYPSIGDYPVSTIGDIAPVRTLEGLPYATRPRVYMFGLGFDGTGTAALADRLEADRIVAFWADPGASADAAGRARESNSELLGRCAVRFSMPLSDVAGAVDTLARLARELEESDKVILVPTGPKPHILACGIVAAQFDHVTMLSPYQGGGGLGGSRPQVHASGEIVCTRIAGT